VKSLKYLKLLEAMYLHSDLYILSGVYSTLNWVCNTKKSKTKRSSFCIFIDNNCLLKKIPNTPSFNGYLYNKDNYKLFKSEEEANGFLKNLIREEKIKNIT
jgi:hypothetical protein